VAPAWDELSVEEWCCQLDSLLHSSLTHVPPLGREEQPHQAIEKIAKSLSNSDSSDRFKRALSNLLQSTPPSRANAERLYRLLYLVAQFTPRSALSVVWKFLRDETLVNIWYDESFHLHALALSILGEYSVDTEAAEYIQATCPAAEDFGVLLSGFRLLARTHDVDEAFRFLKHLIRRMDLKPAYADQTTNLLMGLMGPLPWSALFRFLEWSDRNLKGPSPRGYEQFCLSLRTNLLPWNGFERDDDFQWVCSAWLNAGHHRFTAKEVFDLASRGKAAAMDETFRKVLRRIYDLSVASKMHIPWVVSELPDSPNYACLQVWKSDSDGIHAFDRKAFPDEANLIAEAMPQHLTIGTPEATLYYRDADANATLNQFLFRLGPNATIN
jgi:hypothetical protein